MENSKHTPGPWRVDGPTRFGDMIIAAGDSVPECSHIARTNCANARLIAAAPALLAALEDLHAAHRAFSSADNWTTFDEDARCAAEAALAKARGE